jgi:hypothetical protein
MTYGECLSNQETAKFNSYDNILSTLSKNQVFQEFQQYKCKVVMFINEQIKLRESEVSTFFNLLQS